MLLVLGYWFNFLRGNGVRTDMPKAILLSCSIYRETQIVPKGIMVPCFGLLLESAFHLAVLESL